MSLRGLDDYITGVNIHMVDTAKLKCPNCRSCWESDVYFELGGWFDVDEDKGFCPDCGTEGEQVFERGS